ncbi:phosphate/phosphite/phosphonate ABC transporter substrate-binding protein [Bacillus badius]|uniref:phosphate/phosphite/phosphonate ABC transporter substrate-binding protein n=1 Tax=Bacillus badius TaxID=1455 RepID=UPI0005970520|nr:phosphate/phosphite/phosphonate ABC transporter substrate-binding protein [Bacillus badius]KIL74635.1 Phosphonate ABC transporter phosphate-binding periplasmic component [Bacillus badius]
MKKLLTSIVAVVLLLIVAACSQDTEKNKQKQETIKMGVIPTDDNADVSAMYEPVAEYLKKETGMNVELFLANDYTAVIEAMKNDKIDIARLGAFSYILAADQTKVEPLVAEVSKKTGDKFYTSLLVTRSGSSIKSIKDLKGKTVAFVDPASSSGNLVPRKWLLDNGIDADKDLKEVIYSGGHDASVLAVENKKVDAAFVAVNIYEDMKEKEMASNTVDLEESEKIPTQPIIANSNLDSQTIEKLRTAFMDMDKNAPEILDSFKEAQGFTSVADKDYDGLRELAELLNLDLRKME